MQQFTILTPRGERKIGPGQPTFVIAELSGNHHHDYGQAVRLIDAAAAAGTDAVKLQTYTPDTITIDSNREYFRVTVNDAWRGQTLHELYRQAYTPWEWQPKLKQYAEGKGLTFFSSPFDATAVDFLEKMKVPLYKVASFEVVDIPLLERIGRTKKPVVISRGMSSVAELELALQTLREHGCPAVAVLHCVSAYPAQPADMNLKTIPDIARRFQVVSGLSDHTLGTTAAVAAVALGASIIEKHLTLDRAAGGPDAAFSLEPNELRDLIAAVREAEVALGTPSYEPGAGEVENLTFRKSLFVVADIRRGEPFTDKNIRSIRPGHGLPPKHFRSIIGRRAGRDIARGTPLDWSLIAE